MKRLSFFKVYGRVDPRLEIERISIEVGWFLDNPHATESWWERELNWTSSTLGIREIIGRMPTPEPVTMAADEFGRLVDAEAIAAIRRMALREPVFRHPYFHESETVEAIREREKQNFLCNQRNAKMMAQPTTQRKIDRMFGRHDPNGRKESLAHHARAIRLKLEAKGMDTKQVEKFIASLNLDENAVNQKHKPS